MKLRGTSSLLVVAGLSLTVLSCQNADNAHGIVAPALRANAVSSDTALHIYTTGKVVVAEGSHLELTATRHKDGRVTGVWTVPDARIGSPVEVVAPSDQYDWWCVNTVVENEPDLEGFNIIIYVRDVGDGSANFDELGTSGGFGIDCTSNPTPSRLFQPIRQGDFRTQVRTR